MLTTLGVNTDYSYDSLNRLTLRSVKVNDTLNLNNSYTYLSTSRGETNKSYATTRLGTETIVGVPYGYTYSNMGDIMSITRSGDAYKSYTYDALGEMRSETQHSLNRRTNYVYDAFGNISSKTTVNTNTNANVSKVTYNYGKDSDAGWNYLLTSLTFTDYTNSSNNRTETIDYDKIGNPLSYRGASMSWFGRQMRTYSKGSVSANFMYDADGLRSAKGVNGVKTTYQYVGDQLFYEKIGENKTLYYFYDSYGNLSQIYYTFGTGEDASTARYFVTTNAQGDVLGLYNSNGVKVGAYDYDAWGNTRMFVVTQDADGKNVYTQINPETQYLNHIVNVNPIRYRGYYYDSDLDLYYLQSRYYDAEIGRFINADSVVSGVGGDVLGSNMFAYCLNNPVNRTDPTGNWPKWLEKTVSWVKENVVAPIKNFVAGALSVRHEVPAYNQGDTNLCWAYSQAMIEDFNSGTTRDVDGANQRAREIAVARFGENDWNRGSNPENLVSIGSNSITNIFINLKFHGPLYAAYGFYDEEGVRKGGHAIVVTGVDIINKRVFTNNPEVGAGDQSYEEFLDVFTEGTANEWRLDECFYLG